MLLQKASIIVPIFDRETGQICDKDILKILQYDSAEWEPAFLRQAREFLFFPLLPREASK